MAQNTAIKTTTQHTAQPATTPVRSTFAGVRFKKSRQAFQRFVSVKRISTYLLDELVLLMTEVVDKIAALTRQQDFACCPAISKTLPETHVNRAKSIQRGGFVTRFVNKR